MVAMAIGIPIVLFPAACVRNLNRNLKIAGIYAALRWAREKRAVRAKEASDMKISDQGNYQGAEMTRMKRAAFGALFFLVAILFPVLIWVGFVVAMRKPLVAVMRRFAYATLFLLVGVFMPILIWVGLGVAVRQWMREWMLQREPGRTVSVILAAAGLSVQWAAAEDRALEAAVFLKRPMPEIRGLLTRAGLEVVRL